MPATPAWPPDSSPRLFVEEPLTHGAQVRLDGAQAHYLLSVMRVKDGDTVRLFDDRTGEWRGIATQVRKRDLILDVRDHLREREIVPNLWLCIAPTKKGRIDWVIEKACELGVDRILPIILISSLVGAILGSIWLVAKGRDRATPIPFGPYLAIAGWVVFFWGNDLVDGYLHFAGLR